MTVSIFEEMNTVDKYLFTQLNTVTFSFLYVFKHSQALNLLMQLNSVIDFYVYTAACNDSRYLWGDEHSVDTYLFTQLNTGTLLFLYVFKHSQALNPVMQLNSVIDFYVYTAARSDSRYVWGDEHDGHISLCSWIRCPFHFFMCDEHSEPLSLYTVEYDDPFMSYLPGITIMVDWAFKSYLRS